MALSVFLLLLVKWGQNLLAGPAYGIHSNQANLIVGGLRHPLHQQTRQAPLFQEVPSTRTKTAEESVLLLSHVSSMSSCG
jgi:hypothetical protein